MYLIYRNKGKGWEQSNNIIPEGLSVIEREIYIHIDIYFFKSDIQHRDKCFPLD